MTAGSTGVEMARRTTLDADELSGMARAIRSLFPPVPSPETEAGAERGKPEHAEQALRGQVEPGEGAPEGLEDRVRARDRYTTRDRFTTRVARFLQGNARQRDSLVGGILDDGVTLAEEEEVEPVAGAVFSLVRRARAGISGKGDPPEDAEREILSLARELLRPGVAEWIAGLLGRPGEDEDREEALEVLQRWPDLLVPWLVQSLAETTERSVRMRLVAALADLGEKGRGPAELMTRDSRWYVVRNGIVLLAQIGDEEAGRAVKGLLVHEDARVRHEAVIALGAMKGAGAPGEIGALLNDPDEDVRAAAATAVGLSVALQDNTVGAPGDQAGDQAGDPAGDRTGDPAGEWAEGLDGNWEKVLMDRLAKEESDKVVVQILRALGKVGGPAAVDRIEREAIGDRFSSPPAEIRVAAYEALAQIGSPDARQVLERALSDHDPEIRQAVKRILGAGPRGAAED